LSLTLFPTEAVIWCGDFNYRIGLGLERAHELVRKKDLEKLYENDQVSLTWPENIFAQRLTEGTVKPANGCRIGIPLLFGGPHNFHAHLQI
jgi:hypothetical protein